MTFGERKSRQCFCSRGLGYFLFCAVVLVGCGGEVLLEEPIKSKGERIEHTFEDAGFGKEEVQAEKVKRKVKIVRAPILNIWYSMSESTNFSRRF